MYTYVRTVDARVRQRAARGHRQRPGAPPLYDRLLEHPALRATPRAVSGER